MRLHGRYLMHCFYPRRNQTSHHFNFWSYGRCPTGIYSAFWRWLHLRIPSSRTLQTKPNVSIHAGSISYRDLGEKLWASATRMKSIRHLVIDHLTSRSLEKSRNTKTKKTGTYSCSYLQLNCEKVFFSQLLDLQTYPNLTGLGIVMIILGLQKSPMCMIIC